MRPGRPEAHADKGGTTKYRGHLSQGDTPTGSSWAVPSGRPSAGARHPPLHFLPPPVINTRSYPRRPRATGQVTTVRRPGKFVDLVARKLGQLASRPAVEGLEPQIVDLLLSSDVRDRFAVRGPARLPLLAPGPPCVRDFAPRSGPAGPDDGPMRAVLVRIAAEERALGGNVGNGEPRRRLSLPETPNVLSSLQIRAGG